IDQDPAPAKATLTQLFAQDRIGPELTLLLIGGEPLLARAGLEAVVTHVRALCTSANVHLTIRLTTNGTALTPATLEWLARNQVFVTISFDGVLNSTNRLAKRGRVNNERMVEVINAIPKENVAVRSTLMPDQLLAQADVFEYLDSL